MEDAAGVASAHALRGADAEHFGSLLPVRNSPVADRRQTALITSDRELTEAARSQGLSVLDPESDRVM
jgi:hypothetical protein